MTHEQPAHPDGSAVRSLLAMCGADPGRSQLRELLAACEPELARAVLGRSLTLRVEIVGRCSVRVGLAPDGGLVLPLGPGGPDDAIVRGTAEEVAAFLLGAGTVTEAVLAGLVEVPAGDSALDAAAGVRRVVAGRLGGILGQPAFAIVGARRFLDRLTNAVGWPAAQMACSALLSGAAALASIHPTPVEVRAVAPTYPIASEVVHRPGHEPRPRVQTGVEKATAPRRAGPAHIDEKQPTSTNMRVGVTIEKAVPRPGGGSSRHGSGVEIECGPVTSAVCGVLSNPPTATPAAR